MDKVELLVRTWSKSIQRGQRHVVCITCMAESCGWIWLRRNRNIVLATHTCSLWQKSIYLHDGFSFVLGHLHNGVDTCRHCHTTSRSASTSRWRRHFPGSKQCSIVSMDVDMRLTYSVHSKSVRGYNVSNCSLTRRRSGRTRASHNRHFQYHSSSETIAMHQYADNPRNHESWMQANFIGIAAVEASWELTAWQMSSRSCRCSSEVGSDSSGL